MIDRLLAWLVTWIGIGALIAVILIAIVGCAAPASVIVFPSYLCTMGRIEGGPAAMLCRPVIEEALP